MKYIANLIIFAIWVAGIVIASGFWSTFFAVLIPIWGWYLCLGRFVLFRSKVAP